MNLGEFYQDFFATVWLAWIIAWWVFALNVKATVHREAVLPRMIDFVLLILIGVLLWPLHFPFPLMERFLPISQWHFWVPLGGALTLIGLLFAVWARIYLGRNWSGVVTIKADHELVTSGTYSLQLGPPSHLLRFS